MSKDNTANDKMRELAEKLETGIKDVFESERYKTYLDTVSKFHNYSFNNCILIAIQKPEASYVAGFNAWRTKFKRTVKKGEKGIQIFAPAPYKTTKEVERKDEYGTVVLDKNGKSIKDTIEVTMPSFKVVTVFDVSQTEGEPLPQIGADKLTGNVEKYNDYMSALKEISPVPISIEATGSEAKGYYSSADKRIAVKDGMSELQTIKTVIHEVTHAILHDIDKNAAADVPRPDKRTREVEAESVAYIVCQHYGLDTSDYSFGYIAGWSGEKQLDTLKSSLDTIRKEASAIITGIDKVMAEPQKKQEIALPVTETTRAAPTPRRYQKPRPAMKELDAKLNAAKKNNTSKSADTRLVTAERER